MSRQWKRFCVMLTVSAKTYFFLFKSKVSYYICLYRSRCYILLFETVYVLTSVCPPHVLVSMNEWQQANLNITLMLHTGAQTGAIHVHVCLISHLPCPHAGSVCMLKTGVKDGPNKGKSFYVCVDKQGCDFSQMARYSSIIDPHPLNGRLI